MPEPLRSSDMVVPSDVPGDVLQAILRANPNRIYIYDLLEHRTIYANRNSLDLLGYSREEVETRGTDLFRAIVHPDDVVRVREHHAALARVSGGDALHIEYRIRHANGQWRWLRSSDVVFARNAHGQVWQILGAVEDITERKQAQELLLATEKFRRDVLNSLDARIAVLDESGTIVHVNTAWEQFACENGMSHASQVAVGTNYLDVCRNASGDFAEEAAAALEGIQSVLRGELPSFCLEYPCHSPQLQQWFQMRVMPLSGHMKGAIVSHVSITEHKLAEQQRLEMERRLLHAQKLESLGILAGGIAHDFNNILTGIMGYTDLIMRQLPASEPASQDLDIVKKAIERAAELTRHMLAYSGKGEFIVEAVDLSQIVEDSRKMLEVTVSKKAELKCMLASDLPPIQADASQMHQVILNLVVNASDALGDDPGIIAVSTYGTRLTKADFEGLILEQELAEGPYVCLEVGDNGCGMDEATLQKIFDPFFTTKFTGRGLGLAAVHGIIRGHKGAVRVTSSPGRGTTFQVYFPASHAIHPAGRGPGNAARTAVAQSRPVKRLILVVDDEAIVRTLAQRMIEDAGFSVITACDGEEAVWLYRRHQSEIACVLLDLTMPKMDGAETFRELNRIAPEVRVILTSGYGEKLATARFSGMRLVGFLQKPYEFDALADLLGKATAASEDDSTR